MRNPKLKDVGGVVPARGEPPEGGRGNAPDHFLRKDVGGLRMLHALILCVAVLVSLLLSTAIPTSFNILIKLFLYTCFTDFSLYTYLPCYNVLQGRGKHLGHSGHGTDE